MSVFVVYRKLDFSFPIKEEPKWATQIDRWYQLDAYAFGLAQAYFTLRHSDEAPPDFMFLASSGSSNHTDSQFARTGATSPSKFVHTLPNIRGSSLCQLMGWKGPVLCIQNDPSTQITALRESIDMLNNTRQKIWVWSVTGNFVVHWFALSREKPAKNSVALQIQKEDLQKSLEFTSDRSFHEWLNDRSV